MRYIASVTLQDPVTIGEVELPKGDYEIAYGNDHVLGWFIDIFNEDDQKVFEKDFFWDGYTKRQIAVVLSKLGVKMP